MSVRLTDRCLDLLRLLVGARWLTTSQIHHRFFGHAGLSAARRRLRQLAGAKYLRKLQEDRMREAFFALGPEGKRVLEESGTPAIFLERKPPKQFEHLSGINDVRVAADLTGQVSYFFAAWELPAAGWRQALIPDAVFRLAGRTFALEYDRGLEGVRYFQKSKIAAYRRGLAGCPLAAVLIVADRCARMEALLRAVEDERGMFLLTTREQIRQRGVLAPIFYWRLTGPAVTLLTSCSVEPSPRREDLRLATHVGPRG